MAYLWYLVASDEQRWLQAIIIPSMAHATQMKPLLHVVRSTTIVMCPREVQLFLITSLRSRSRRNQTVRKRNVMSLQRIPRREYTCLWVIQFPYQILVWDRHDACKRCILKTIDFYTLLGNWSSVTVGRVILESVDPPTKIVFWAIRGRPPSRLKFPLFKFAAKRGALLLLTASRILWPGSKTWRTCQNSMVIS